MTTKNDLVLAACEELRISGLTTKPTFAQITSAIRLMDNMVLSWQNIGLCLSYVRSESFNDIDPNQDSGLNDVNVFAVIMNLAKTLGPRFGKQVIRQTLVDAKDSYEGLFSPELTMREQTPYLPSGSGESFFFGNRIGGYCFNYFQTFDENAPDYCTTKDILVGQTDFYGVDFNSYLSQVDGDTIASFTIEDGEGAEVLESAQLDGFINIKVQGSIEGYAPVLITVITTLGRTLPENVNFNVIAN